MTRKATAKRSEANAAVRRRAAGLDQRFKMSCLGCRLSYHLCGGGVPELFARSRRASEHRYSVLQLLQLHSRPSQRFELEDLCGAELLQRRSRCLAVY